MSSTSPSWSTARHKYFNAPLILMKTSFRMPGVAGPGPAAAQPTGVGLAELHTPPPDRLAGDDHTALEHQLLHLTEAEREPEVQPYTVEIASTRHRCPLYNADALPTIDPPPTVINPKITPPGQST
jgi:hypothetical protein